MITKITIENTGQGKDKNRKEIILEVLVKEYLQTGEPVASDVLGEKYELGISSATIRNCFVILTEKGYLHKPYISSGRVPTDKAWKFFIEKIFKEDDDFLNHWEKMFSDQLAKVKFKQIENQKNRRKIKELVELIADKSHSFSFCYLIQEKELIKQGLKYMFSEMIAEELLSLELLQEIAESLERLEIKLENMKIDETPLVLIGKDNPFIKSDQFSSLLTAISQPKAIFGILGPKRMPYERNIAILRALTNLTI